MANWRDPQRSLSPISVATSGAEYGLDVVYDVQPAANTSALYVASRGHARVTTNVDVTGAGHPIGALGYVTHEGTGTCSLMVGSEGLAGNLSTGTVTQVSCLAAHLNENNGTITLAKLGDFILGDIAGDITSVYGCHIQCDINKTDQSPSANSTVSNFWGVVVDDLDENFGTISTIGGYVFNAQSSNSATTKYAVLNSDSGATITSLGHVVAPGVPYQIVEGSTSAAASTTATIPFDTSVPQSTEGYVMDGGSSRLTLQATITPKSTSNTLVITVDLNMVADATGGPIVVTLWNDSGDVLRTWPEYVLANLIKSYTFTHTMTAPSTSSETFTVNVGSQNGAGFTLYINQYNTSSQLFGGSERSSIRIVEYGA